MDFVKSFKVWADVVISLDKSGHEVWTERNIFCGLLAPAIILDRYEENS